MTWRRLLVFAAADAVGLGAVPGAVGLDTVLNDEQENPVETPRLVYDGDTLELDADGQGVRGRTEPESGKGVTVRLKSSGSSPFLMQQTATVDQDGGFGATFNPRAILSVVGFLLTDSEATVTLLHAAEADQDIETAKGMLRGRLTNCSTTVSTPTELTL